MISKEFYYSEPFCYTEPGGEIYLLAHAHKQVGAKFYGYFIFRSIRFGPCCTGRCFTGGAVFSLPTVGVPPKVGPCVGMFMVISNVNALVGG